jgi:endonuclease/exonuclease/phosphatase family metal-dependent hydrolase
MGPPFESKGEPDAKNGPAGEGSIESIEVYTLDELAALNQFAKDRGVVIVPELDMPGHSAAWGKAFPDLLVDCPKTVRSSHTPLEVPSLDPSSPEVYDIIFEALLQISKVFASSPFFHIGGDEVNLDCWRESERVRDWMMNSTDWREGDGIEKAWQEFESRVLDMVARLGKRPIVWEETQSSGALPSKGDRYPQQVVVQPWKCWAGLAARAAREADRYGRAVVQSACMYLDWEHVDFFDLVSSESLRQAAAAMRTSLTTASSTLNRSSIVRRKLTQQGLLGGEASLWTEEIDFTNFECRLWPRAGAVAAVLWGGGRAELDSTLSSNDQKHQHHDHQLRQFSNTADHLGWLESAAASVEGGGIEGSRALLSAYAHFTFLLRRSGVASAPVTLQYSRDSDNICGDHQHRMEMKDHQCLTGDEGSLSCYHSELATLYTIHHLVTRPLFVYEDSSFLVSSGALGASIHPNLGPAAIRHHGTAKPDGKIIPITKSKSLSSVCAVFSVRSQCRPMKLGTQHSFEFSRLAAEAAAKENPQDLMAGAKAFETGALVRPVLLPEPFTGKNDENSGLLVPRLRVAQLNAMNGATDHDRLVLLEEWGRAQARAGAQILSFCEMNNWNAYSNGGISSSNSTRSSAFAVLASRMGFTNSHIFDSGQPYHLGIMSAHEFIVLGRYGPTGRITGPLPPEYSPFRKESNRGPSGRGRGSGSDSSKRRELLQRGLLWIYIPALRLHYMVLHLHAQNSERRADEGEFVASIVQLALAGWGEWHFDRDSPEEVAEEGREDHFEGLDARASLILSNRQRQPSSGRLIVVGDFNSLSPIDAKAHREQGLLRALISGRRTVSTIRTTMTEAEKASTWAIGAKWDWYMKKFTFPPPPSSANHQQKQQRALDYRPLALLLKSGLLDSCAESCYDDTTVSSADTQGSAASGTDWFGSRSGLQWSLHGSEPYSRCMRQRCLRSEPTLLNPEWVSQSVPPTGQDGCLPRALQGQKQVRDRGCVSTLAARRFPGHLNASEIMRLKPLEPPAMRLDFILLSPVLLQAARTQRHARHRKHQQSVIRAAVEVNGLTDWLSDHYPLHLELG